MGLYLAYDDYTNTASFEVVKAVSELDARNLANKISAIELVEGLKFHVVIASEYGEMCSGQVVVHK